jgi:hypothetical protein
LGHARAWGRQYAPTWLVQMPWLLTATHQEQLRDQLQAALVSWLHQRTDGQPWCPVALGQTLVEQGMLHEYNGCWRRSARGHCGSCPGVSESLRQLLE